MTGLSFGLRLFHWNGIFGAPVACQRTVPILRPSVQIHGSFEMKNRYHFYDRFTRGEMQQLSAK